MIQTAHSIENFTLNITHQIHILAPMDGTFETLLEELGPHNEVLDGTPMPKNLSHGPGAGGTGIWVITTVISGGTCRPSSGQRCSKSADLYLCPIQSSRI